MAVRRRVRLRPQPDLQYHDISRQVNPITSQVLYKDFALNKAEIITEDDDNPTETVVDESGIVTVIDESGDPLMEDGKIKTQKLEYRLGTAPGMNNFGGPNPGSSLSPDPTEYEKESYTVPGLAFTTPAAGNSGTPKLVQPNIPDAITIRDDDPEKVTDTVPVVGRGRGAKGATLYYSVVDTEDNDKVLDHVSFTISLNDPIPEVVVEQGDLALMVGCGVEEQLSQGPRLTGLRYEYMASVLPDGVMINKGTGLLTGTPTEAGTFPVQYSITSHNDETGICKVTVLNFEITVLPGDILNEDDKPYFPESESDSTDGTGTGNSGNVSSTSDSITLKFLSVPCVNQYKHRHRINNTGAEDDEGCALGYKNEDGERITPEEYYNQVVGSSESLDEFLQRLETQSDSGTGRETQSDSGTGRNSLTNNRLGDPISAYNYLPDGSTDAPDFGPWSNISITDPNNRIVQEITIEGLDPNTVYEIQIASVTPSSNSGYTSVFGKTLSRQPVTDADYAERSLNLLFSDDIGVPEIINAHPFQSGVSARVRWRTVDNANAYMFIYSDNLDDLTSQDVRGTPNTSVVLTGLTENTTYYVSVQAANDLLVGGFSEVFEFKTANVRVPIKQFGLEYRGNVDSGSAYISWRDPILGQDYTPPGFYLDDKGELVSEYGDAQGYLVSYRKVGADNYIELSTPFQGIVIPKLEDGEQYEIYVTPFNFDSEVNNGYGVLSDILEFEFDRNADRLIGVGERLSIADADESVVVRIT